MTTRLLGLIASMSLLMTACESSPPAVQFAADQVLRLVAPQDVLTLDPAKTVLISMDFNQRNCVQAQRSRCAFVLPKAQALIAAARAKGMMVVHT